jgi:uncharacterized protein YndB with AHSA1/START domain
MKNLTFSAKISAPVKKVWDTMLSQDTYQKWTAAAWPGSMYVGTWQQGENVRFVGANGGGTLANLIAVEPYKHIKAIHNAILLEGGIEDRDSEWAKKWVGSIEEYTFSEKNGVTELLVSMTIYPEWEKMFNNDWPKALAALKDLCEGDN